MSLATDVATAEIAAAPAGEATEEIPSVIADFNASFVRFFVFLLPLANS
ncbi:MAG: hypothetical protein IJ328_05345 [Muribaculaceae bacterium]|nr:hypothetical protein [Muribaculaceae bacterium]